MQAMAKLTSKGQVTLPKGVRDALRLRQGDTVVFDVDEQGVRLRPLQQASVFAQYEGALRDGHGQSIEEVVTQIAELRGRHTE